MTLQIPNAVATYLAGNTIEVVMNTLQNTAEIPNFDRRINSAVVVGVRVIEQKIKPETQETKKNDMRVSLCPIAFNIIKEAMFAKNSEDTDATMLLKMLPPTYFILKLIR